MIDILSHFARYNKKLLLYLDQYNITEKLEQEIYIVKKQKYIVESLREDIQFQNQRRKSYYDQHRQAKSSLKKRDKVYLLSRNIETKRLNKKLNYKKLGLYKILEAKKGDTFKLELPKGIKIFDTFHISLLEPAPKNLRT